MKQFYQLYIPLHHWPLRLTIEHLAIVLYNCFVLNVHWLDSNKLMRHNRKARLWLFKKKLNVSIKVL